MTSLGGYANTFFTRFIRYASTGGVAEFIDYALLIVLIEVFNVFYLASTSGSFAVGMLASYMINKKWGFKDTKATVMRSASFFTLFSVIALILVVVIVGVLVTSTGMHYLYARVITTVIVGLFTFGMNYSISFRMQHA